MTVTRTGAAAGRRRARAASPAPSPEGGTAIRSFIRLPAMAMPPPWRPPNGGRRGIMSQGEGLRATAAGQARHRGAGVHLADGGRREGAGGLVDDRGELGRGQLRGCSRAAGRRCRRPRRRRASCRRRSRRSRGGRWSGCRPPAPPAREAGRGRPAGGARRSRSSLPTTAEHPLVAGGERRCAGRAAVGRHHHDAARQGLRRSAGRAAGRRAGEAEVEHLDPLADGEVHRLRQRVAVAHRLARRPAAAASRP